MITIIVESEADAEALLKESEYLHYLKEVDTDKAPVLTHLYLNPETVKFRLATGFVYAPYIPDAWKDKHVDLENFFKGAMCRDCKFFERDTIMDTMGFCTDPYLYPEGIEQTWRPLDASPNTPTCFTTEKIK